MTIYSLKLIISIEAFVIKAAAYRLATPKVMTKLIKHDVNSNRCVEKDYVIHPVFYIRHIKLCKDFLLSNDVI